MAQPPRDASTGEAPSGVRQVCDATGGKTERVGLFAQPENAFDAVLYALAASVVKSGQASRFLSTPSGMAAGEGRDRGPPVLMPSRCPFAGDLRRSRRLKADTVRRTVFLKPGSKPP